MVASLKSLIGRGIRCNDGSMGRIVDIHLHSGAWEVEQIAIKAGGAFGRVLVVDTNGIDAAQLLSSAIALPLSGAELRQAKQLGDAPPMDWRVACADYNLSVCATHWSPWAALPEGIGPMVPEPGPQLYSLKHLLGYLIRVDGGRTIGKVVDFSVDEATWHVSTIAARVSDKGADKYVALDVGAIADVDFEHRMLALNIEQDAVLAAPLFPSEAQDEGRGLAASLRTCLSGRVPVSDNVSRGSAFRNLCSLERMQAFETFPVYLDSCKHKKSRNQTPYDFSGFTGHHPLQT